MTPIQLDTARCPTPLLLDGIFEEHAALGYGSTITYCRDTGPTVVTMKAVDSSGNVSGPSNELLFDC